MLKIGKLYSCSGYFLLLYPDKETAALLCADHVRCPACLAGLAATAGAAAYWSKYFDKPVSYCDPLTPLLILSVNEKYHEVLAGDQKGWIIYHNWLEIKEIVDEAA